MKDWRGFEGIFHRGDLPVEDLLELTEPHFRFRPTRAPELSIFRHLATVARGNEIFHEDRFLVRTSPKIPKDTIGMFGRELTELEEKRRRLEGKSNHGLITGITE